MNYVKVNMRSMRWHDVREVEGGDKSGGTGYMWTSDEWKWNKLFEKWNGDEAGRTG